MRRDGGCGYDALLTQSLDNACGVAHLPTESGEGDGMRDCHFAYYLALVKTAHTEVAAPRQRDGWLRRLDADNDNIRAALTWGSERDPRAALQLAVDASWHWWYRLRHLEGVGWLETLLESAPDDTLLQARALAHIGLLAREYGDVERAQRVLSEARVRFDALGNRRGQAHVLNTLTLLCLAQERLADARAAATECLRRTNALGSDARLPPSLPRDAGRSPRSLESRAQPRPPPYQAPAPSPRKVCRCPRSMIRHQRLQLSADIS
jgi:hypothetical protein